VARYTISRQLNTPEFTNQPHLELDQTSFNGADFCFVNLPETRFRACILCALRKKAAILYS
jgi:uncharacterized protein YjbI with pentapeptide repeats